MPATAVAGVPTDDDAELLVLGAELDTIAEGWLAQRALDRAEDAVIHARVKQLTGIAACDAPPYDKDSPYWTIR